MLEPSDINQERERLRARVLGLGETSLHKSYYPQLRQRLTELEFHAALLDAVNDSVIVHDLAGQLRYANKTACEIRGLSLEEMLDSEPFSWICREHREAALLRATEVALQGSMICESFHLRGDEDTIPVEVHYRLIARDGEDLIIGVVRDLTERLHTEQYIHNLAYYDSLTHLANRALFNDRLDMALAHGARANESLALMFLDLDHFKAINDTFGHPLGDNLLKAVALRLQALVREGDTVGRFGGDEFVLLLHDCDETGVPDVAQRVLDAFEAPFHIGDQELSITASIGVAVAVDGISDSETLMRHADTAMYQAKAAGRSAYRLYDPSMDLSVGRFLLLGGLRQAQENRELSLHYQPLVDISNGSIVAAEALLRWNHPEHGNVSPAEFIPLAEESGLIVKIGEWVLREACKQAAEWREAGLPTVRMAVNLSARQLYCKNLIAVVARVLDECGLQGNHLELEITESAATKDVVYVYEQFKALKQLDVNIAIDDFGTGHSSLDRLKRFPVDTLKVDRSFVRDIAYDPGGRAIATSIIVLGHSLGLNVIAEGVETEDQLRFLQSKGCHFAQGYLYSPPVPPAQFAELLGGRGTSGWAELGGGKGRA